LYIFILYNIYVAKYLPVAQQDKIFRVGCHINDYCDGVTLP